MVLPTLKMSVSKAVKVYLPKLIDKNIIPVLIGNPGISKTEQLHQLCKDKNWGLLVVHLALMPIETLSGIPEIYKEENLLKTKWSIPEIVVRANDLAEKYETVILFFDDIHLADKSRQAYFFELATEHKLQGYKLSDNVKIVCAGNPTAKAGAKTFLSAIVNRFTFIHVYMPVKDWLKWANANAIHPLVIAFISANEEKEFYLCGQEDTKPYPTPRSWTKVSNILYAFQEIYGDIKIIEKDVKVNNELANIISGTIGSEVTQEFLKFIKYTFDVNFDELFKNPTKLLEFDTSKRIAVFYTMVQKVFDEKYRKYLLRFLDFAYSKLGANGSRPHFAFSIISICREFHKNLFNELITMSLDSSNKILKKYEDTIVVPKDKIVDVIYQKLKELLY